jgi:hypothetical protein
VLKIGLETRGLRKLRVLESAVFALPGMAKDLKVYDDGMNDGC